MGDKPGQGVEIVEDESGPKAFDRALAVALRVERKRHPGGVGSFSIDLAVADEKGAVARQCRKRGQQGGGVGLALGQGIAANHHAKMAIQTEMPQSGAGGTCGLVRADAEGVASGVKAGQRLGHTRIKLRKIQRFFVDLDEVLHHFGLQGPGTVKPPADQQSADQNADAIADEPADSRKRKRLQPSGIKYFIRSSVNVRRAVDQRSVQIEDQRQRVRHGRPWPQPGSPGCWRHKLQAGLPSRP